MQNNQIIHVFTTMLLLSILSGCQTAPKSATTGGVSAIQPDSKSSQQAAKPTLYQQAVQSSRDGKIDDAIQMFQQVIQKDPSTPHAYTNLGLLYFHKKQIDAAKDAFQQAIQQDKTDAIAYNHLAVIQRQQGEFKMALFNYYKAINADPEYANAHLNLGILLDIYLQELPKALEQYEIFQQLTGNSNKEVEKWVLDIKRRIDSQKANK